MKARSKGTVVLLATGLVLAVAVPAGAQAPSPPAQQIVTALSRHATLTMKSGLSQYLFVGGSSADAVNSQTTFQHIGNINCGSPRSQGPIGPSTAGDAQGSFVTTGKVSAIAGVGISGYSVKPLFPAQGFQHCESSSTRSPIGTGLSFSTKVGEIVLILVGTDGVGSLAPDLENCNTTNSLDPATLQNDTVSKGNDDGAAVAVFSASLQAGDDCTFEVYGTSYTTVPQGFGLWLRAYSLVPKK
jgi:hypothetical protein